jgi:HlyD family type I secretion membrane fusion protein
MNTTLAPADAAFTLASLLHEAAPRAEDRASLRSARRAVLWPFVAAAGLISLWCAWAPLHGAVVVNGQVQTEFGRKTVQHQEGGIVRELLVRPGQAVRRGDPLLVVGDLRNDATLEILRKQRAAEQLRAERSRAELNLARSVAWPADSALDADALQRERQLFDSRRRTLDEQLAALQSQSAGARSRIAALTAQLESSDRSTRLARDELDLNAGLVQSGYIQKTRLITLERGVADLLARAEAARGQIAEARMQVSSLDNAMAQARGAYQQRAGDELKDASARLREIEDRLRPSQDQVERQTVRAPVDGTVMGLRVSAPGTAVGPRDPLLEIVPSNEALRVEVQIDPHDIDHVRIGDAAEVRLAAFNARRTPLLKAVVRSVSADAVVDAATRQSWYAAQVEVSAEELARQPELRLQTGMPAEVFVTTPARSLFEYLAEPVSLFARRALREP